MRMGSWAKQPCFRCWREPAWLWSILSTETQWVPALCWAPWPLSLLSHYFSPEAALGAGRGTHGRSSSCAQLWEWRKADNLEEGANVAFLAHGRKQRDEGFRGSGKHRARQTHLKMKLSPPQSPALCIDFIISDDNDDWGFPAWNRDMRASAIPSYHCPNELPVSSELIHELLLLLPSPV